MVPRSYLEFMITSASAAGAMIGLLFVAVSFRSDLVFGSRATQRVRTLAGSSFTGLVNAFSLSLLAVVPTTNIGVSMVVLSVICLFTTITLHANGPRDTHQYRLLILTGLTYVAQFAGGVTLLVRPHAVWIVNATCYLIFASFVLALVRAWQLLRAEGPTPTESAP